jgi:hypothetical protein
MRRLRANRGGSSSVFYCACLWFIAGSSGEAFYKLRDGAHVMIKPIAFIDFIDGDRRAVYEDAHDQFVIDDDGEPC